RAPLVPRRVLEGPGPTGAGPARQCPRIGRLGAGGPQPVASDPALPALRRQPRVHPERGTSVQRQRGELQWLVPAAAVAAQIPPPGGPASGADAAAGGGQPPACSPEARGQDPGAAPPRPAAAEAAQGLRSADGAVAP